MAVIDLRDPNRGAWRQMMPQLLMSLVMKKMEHNMSIEDQEIAIKREVQMTAAKKRAEKEVEAEYAPKEAEREAALYKTKEQIETEEANKRAEFAEKVKPKEDAYKVGTIKEFTEGDQTVTKIYAGKDKQGNQVWKKMASGQRYKPTNPPAPKEPKTTSSIEEYKYAKEHDGFKGSFQEWLKTQSSQNPLWGLIGGGMNNAPTVPAPPQANPAAPAALTPEEQKEYDALMKAAGKR